MQARSNWIGCIADYAVFGAKTWDENQNVLNRPQFHHTQFCIPEFPQRDMEKVAEIEADPRFLGGKLD